MLCCLRFPAIKDNKSLIRTCAFLWTDHICKKSYDFMFYYERSQINALKKRIYTVCISFIRILVLKQMYHNLKWFKTNVNLLAKIEAENFRISNVNYGMGRKIQVKQYWNDDSCSKKGPKIQPHSEFSMKRISIIDIITISHSIFSRCTKVTFWKCLNKHSPLLLTIQWNEGNEWV